MFKISLNFIKQIITLNSKMGILINSYCAASRLITILLISLFINISVIHCEPQSQPTIKILGQVYFNLPQISDDDYTVVPQIMISTQPVPIAINPIQPNNVPKSVSSPTSHRFVAKQKGDYFVTQAADTTHQSTRYNLIKGKNIFTPSYINSQVLESTELPDPNLKDLAALSNTLREEFNKNFQQLKELDKKPQTNKSQKPSVQREEKKQEKKQENPQIIVEQKESKAQQTVQDKSSQIYKQFQNIEALKEKNLRDNTRNEAEQQRFQNLQKLVGYIVIGLVISFAILKRATKSPEASLPKTNQERTQLRLRDTADDEDEESEESSGSDQ